MPTFGPSFTRSKPRIQVLTGFNPTEPSSGLMPERYPVKSGETIKSGQVISKELVGGAYQWVKGGAAGRQHFLALRDSSDLDVVEAGNLPGIPLSLRGVKVQTPYYKSADANNLNDGAELTFDGTTGDLKVASNGDRIIAVVTNGQRGPAVGYSNEDATSPLTITIIGAETGLLKA